MMVEITVQDPLSGDGRTYRFTRSPAVIGRDPAADVCLPQPFVSTRHALVSFADERAELVDLGSTNGTLYRGRPLPPHRPLAIPDEVIVTIGRIEVQIRHLTGTAEDAVALDQVHAAIRRLRPLYTALQGARAAYEAAYVEALADIPSERRGLAAAMIERDMPDAHGGGGS